MSNEDRWTKFEKEFRNFDSFEFNEYLGLRVNLPIVWCRLFALSTILQFDELLLLRVLGYYNIS